MKERIQQFLQVENKSSAQFAEEIGVQASSVSHILSGRNNPSLDFILKMLAKFPDISTEWLLFGKGAMYKAPKSAGLFTDSTDYKDDKPMKSDISPSSADNQEKPEASKSRFDERVVPETDPESPVKVLFFYSDGTFTEFFPR